MRTLLHTTPAGPATRRTPVRSVRTSLPEQQRDLMSADEDALIADVMSDPHVAEVTEDAEVAARRTTDCGLLALPVVDGELLPDREGCARHLSATLGIGATAKE